jgi:hypothetical protein
MVQLLNTLIVINIWIYKAIHHSEFTCEIYKTTHHSEFTFVIYKTIHHSQFTCVIYKAIHHSQFTCVIYKTTHHSEFTCVIYKVIHHSEFTPAYGVYIYIYMSLSWYDIPKLVVPIRISLIEGYCHQGSYWTKDSYWLSWSHHFESFTVATMTWLTVIWNNCVTNDHGYVPLIVNTPRSFPHSWLVTFL